jgi:hypothetical protein
MDELIQKLVEYLDRENRIYDSLVKDNDFDSSKLSKRAMYYAIDTCWTLGIITLEQKREYESKYKCAYCF